MALKRTTQATPGTPAVLVVESGKFQRRSLCRLIRAAGAEHVAEALDLQDAERVLGERRSREWMLVVDPDLLGTASMPALKALSDRFPVAGVLLLTHRRGAFEELRDLAQRLRLTLVDVLRKPVSAEEVGTLLRQLAQASAGAARLPALSKEELSECLRAGSMRARFQPKIDLESGQPICCEALAFVTHPRHGVVPAARFAQALGQLGAQRVMTASVLRDAAELVRQLREHALDTKVAVSLGPDMLSENSDAASLDAYVRTLGIRAEDLVLDIGGAGAALSSAAAADNLARLKLRGYRLVLREDGAPVSLSDPVYAHFSEIKLHVPEGADARDGSEAEARMHALLAAARKHGMAACAANLAAGANLEQLRRAGFSYAEGESISPPLPAEEALIWIQHEEKARHYARRKESQPLAG